MHFRRCIIFLQLDQKLLSTIEQNKNEVLAQGSAHLELPGRLIDTNLISRNAMYVLKTLHDANYKAYLVGGGVRDLILGQVPKDFDIVTNAVPEAIVKLFPRSRIIGRRFKLVHVLTSNQNIIEVATFRRNITPEPNKASGSLKAAASGMILRDNIYGTSLKEDASRRDYTINALYYSPFENVIHDFHAGFFDLVHGNIEMIGDPMQRFHEDPVRMIRAYRFAAKLEFTITPRTAKDIPELLPLLSQIPPARMFEEFVKIFLTGHGARSFDILMRDDVLKYLLVDMGSMLYSRDYVDFVRYALTSSDKRHHEGKHNMPHFLFAVMLWPLCEQIFYRMQHVEPFNFKAPNKVITQAADIVLNGQKKITSIPQLALADISDIWRMQIELEDEHNANNPEAMVWQGIFRASLEFLSLRARFDENLAPIAAQWIESYEFYVPPEKRSRKSLTKKDQEQASRANMAAGNANTPNANNLGGTKKKRHRSHRRNKASDTQKSERHTAAKLRREKLDFKAASAYIDNLPF